MTERVCLMCDEPFSHRRARTLTCSAACSHELNLLRQREYRARRAASGNPVGNRPIQEVLGMTPDQIRAQEWLCRPLPHQGRCDFLGGLVR